MTMDATTAVRQAAEEPWGYSYVAIRKLCEQLEIDRTKPGWRAELAPFASVLAAMIAASATDYDTAIWSGAVKETWQAGILDKLDSLIVVISELSP